MEGGLNMKHGPHWENHCEHPTDTFVGTIGESTEHEFVDVYVYKPKKANIYKVCLRYGEQADDYLSPYGDVNTFLYSTDNRQNTNPFDRDTYRIVLSLTDNRGDYSTDTYRLAAELIHARCEFVVNIKQMED
jgi:hypothetical protein